jgi:hypothetical protein
MQAVGGVGEATKDGGGSIQHPLLKPGYVLKGLAAQYNRVRTYQGFNAWICQVKYLD